MTKNEERLSKLFNELVPDMGKADSLAGELVRAINRIGYRFCNDGDMVNQGYGKETCNAPARFLMAKGNHEIADLTVALWEIFSEDAYEKVMDTLEGAVADYIEQKANPSLGQTIQIQRVRDAYQEALDNPAEENVFKQLRLNMWVSSLTRFIPEHIYNLGNQPIDMEALKGRDCYGGLDLSSTGDITAFVLIFPPRVPEEKYIMLPFFWIPEDTIPQRVRRASVPYDIRYQQGYLIATEGNVIHYGFIEKVIEELGKTYHIKEIAFDRWGAVQMTQNLEGMGFTVVPFGQGFKDMSPPTKEFYKLLMEGRIIHGGNPVMAWMAGNVVVDTDPAGNIKPTKAKSPEKIDGIVAAIMALDRCIRNEGQQQGSVYDERDMIVF